MASFQDFLDGADGLADIYGKVKGIDSSPVEATEPRPDPDRQTVETSSGFQGFSQFGLQSSLGVVGLIAFVFFMAAN